jgi:hypothetical protein
MSGREKGFVYHKLKIRGSLSVRQAGSFKILATVLACFSMGFQLNYISTIVVEPVSDLPDALQDVHAARAAHSPSTILVVDLVVSSDMPSFCLTLSSTAVAYPDQDLLWSAKSAMLSSRKQARVTVDSSNMSSRNTPHAQKFDLRDVSNPPSRFKPSFAS